MTASGLLVIDPYRCMSYVNRALVTCLTVFLALSLTAHSIHQGSSRLTGKYYVASNLLYIYTGTNIFLYNAQRFYLL